MGMTVMILILVIFLAVAVAIVYYTGLLVPRKYTCKIFIPRAEGRFKLVEAKGRFIKDAKFEVSYSWDKKVIVDAPLEKYVHEGDVLWGQSTTEKEIIWIPDIEISADSVQFNAAIPEAAQITWATVFASQFERTHQQSPLLQILIPAAFIIGALIIFFGAYIGNKELSDSNHALAASNSAFAEKLLANSTVHIYQNYPADTTYSANTSSGLPQTPPNPNAPKG